MDFGNQNGYQAGYFPNSPYQVPYYPQPGSFAQQVVGMDPSRAMMNQRQATRPQTLYCRYVNSEQEIVPNEIPMDGNIALFPSFDNSCIYGKVWTTNSGIQSVKYIPEPVQSMPDPKEDIYSRIMDRLDKIESLLKNSDLEQPKTLGGSDNA